MGVLVGLPAGWVSPCRAQESIRYTAVHVDPDEPRGTAAVTLALPPLPSIPSLPAVLPDPATSKAGLPALPIAPTVAEIAAIAPAAGPEPVSRQTPAMQSPAADLAPATPAANSRRPTARERMAQAQPTQEKPATEKSAPGKPATGKPAPEKPAQTKPAYRPPITPPAPAALMPAAATMPAAPTSLAPRAAEGGPSLVSLEINRGQVIRLPRPAATVFIANPEIADVQVKSANLVYVFAKKGGETTLVAADDQDRILVDARVVVTANVERLREGIKQLVPNRQIQVSSVGGQFVLDGRVASPTESEDIRRMASAIVGDERQVINRLKVTGPVQVNLRVRVAEMTKEITKQLGFNWALARDILSTTSELAATLTVVNPETANIANKFQVTGRRGAFDVNTIIDAMDEENLVKILAQPNLTAISGQTASFLAGGEFPILVPQTLNLVTIEYKKFGVQLAFQPTVLNDNRINLHVRPEVSELSDDGAVVLAGFVIPALTTRRAETTVEVASGQSFAIAGLIRNDVTHQVTKWPGLADIPILGALFRSDTFKRNESELVIIVTPYIVEPVDTAQQVAAPTDGFRPAHDLDRIFLGAQWRRDVAPGSTEALVGRRPRLTGPAGFQLE